MEKHLVLASGSPRRRELLAKMGYRFEIITADVDESITTDDATGENIADNVKRMVECLAVRKGKAVFEKTSGAYIIAADTLVSLDGKPLGKPTDEANAYEMLRALSGRENEVFSGVCVIAPDGKLLSTSVRTGVTFREMTDEEINAYIATGEPMDKAGAYGIQGGAGKFVIKLDGSYDNVIGFPTETVETLLSNIGYK